MRLEKPTWNRPAPPLPGSTLTLSAPTPRPSIEKLTCTVCPATYGVTVPRTTIRPPTSANGGLPPTFSSASLTRPGRRGAVTAGAGAGGAGVGASSEHRLGFYAPVRRQPARAPTARGGGRDQTDAFPRQRDRPISSSEPAISAITCRNVQLSRLP